MTFFTTIFGTLLRVLDWKACQLPILAGKMYWRARLGCEYEEVVDDTGDLTVIYPVERPYGVSAMKPISNWRSEGRANPRGIPYLYLATTRETALAEVRPWIDATISVAQLQVRRDLNVIDCSRHYAKESLSHVMEDQTCRVEDGMWVAIDQAFAKPVSRDEEESKEYVPTQIIAELFKSAGFDGIMYKSLLSADGLNLAIFNLDDANVVHRALCKVESIHFVFRSVPTDAARPSA